MWKNIKSINPALHYHSPVAEVSETTTAACSDANESAATEGKFILFKLIDVIKRAGYFLTTVPRAVYAILSKLIASLNKADTDDASSIQSPISDSSSNDSNTDNCSISSTYSDVSNRSNNEAESWVIKLADTDDASSIQSPISDSSSNDSDATNYFTSLTYSNASKSSSIEAVDSATYKDQVIHLSPNKLAYLKQVNDPNFNDYHLLYYLENLKELIQLVRHYEKKLQIKIYINGEFDPVFRLEQRLDNLTEDLDDLAKQINSGPELNTDTEWQLQQKAKLKERKELEEFLSDRLNEEKSEALLNSIKRSDRDEDSLTAERATKELEKLSLEAQLTHTFSGYFFTCGTLDNIHIDRYLVTPQANIIYTIPFPNLELEIGSWYKRPSPQNIYTSDVGKLLTPSKEVCPQAEDPGGVCGSLGVSYLKEYLKDDAAQLKEYTLMITHPLNDALNRFHLPSPQVLKYSQSSLYIKLVYAMVSGQEAYVEVSHQHKTYEIPTLRHLLNTGEIRRPHSSDLLVQADLEQFASAWINKHREIQTKRAGMNDIKGLNSYLTYTSVRYQGKIKK